MKKNILLSLCYLAVIFALFLLVGGKSKTIGKKLLAEQSTITHSYGDLYLMAGLSDYKFSIPFSQITSNNTNTLQNSDILTLGDSFFQAKFETKNIPDLLSGQLNKKVFDPQEILGNPLVYLAAHNYQKGENKIVIVETVERYAAKRMASYPEKIQVTPMDTKPNFKKRINDLALKLFNQTDLIYFFKHNIIINPIRLFINNLEFKTLGLANNNVGRYSINPPMLFYSEEVDFSTNPHATENMEVLAKNVKWLGDTLKERYNLEMIYVVIPNKYTIYNYLDKNGEYNNFIPKLQTELDKNKVNYIDLYTPYKNYTKNPTAPLLYYPNDTHFTAVGKDILLQELLKKIKP